MTILLVYPLHATRFGGSKPHVPNWNWNKWMYQTHFQANPCSVKKAIKLVDHRCKVRGGANFWSLKKISWCYDPCQRSSQRGWWILIPSYYHQHISQRGWHILIPLWRQVEDMDWILWIIPPFPIKHRKGDGDDDDYYYYYSLEVWSNVRVGNMFYLFWVGLLVTIQ